MDDALREAAAVLSRLTGSRPPEQPRDEKAFDEWSDLVEAESELAGVVATATAGGGVDHAALARVRAVVERSASYRAWRADLRAVVRIVGGGHADEA